MYIPFLNKMYWQILRTSFIDAIGQNIRGKSKCRRFNSFICHIVSKVLLRNGVKIVKLGFDGTIFFFFSALTSRNNRKYRAIEKLDLQMTAIETHQGSML
jgi:hypothetical protein